MLFKLLLTLFFFLGFLSCFGQDQIILEGKVPAGITPGFLSTEYIRIYHLVAPQQTPDKTPFTIRYYSKKNPGANASLLPEWGGGGTIGRNLIIVPIDFSPFLEQSFPQITVHELVHLALNRAYPMLAIPRWFHEGVAMTLAGELSMQENVEVSKAIFMGTLLLPAAIDSVNTFDRDKANRAYSQAHLSVLYLVDQYGMDIVPDILNAARRSRDFWKGVGGTLGISPQEFNGLLRKYLSEKYQFVFLVADTYAYWMLIVVLFIIGFIVTGRRNKKRAIAMEEAEKRELEKALEISENHPEKPPEQTLPQL